MIAHVQYDEEKMIYYAGNIQKLQRELVDANIMDPSFLPNFPNLRMNAYAEPQDYARYLHNEYTAYRHVEEPQSDRQWLRELYRESGVLLHYCCIRMNFCLYRVKFILA